VALGSRPCGGAQRGRCLQYDPSAGTLWLLARQSRQTREETRSRLHQITDDLLIRGDSIEYHWTLIGTNTGPGGTGNRVRIAGFEDWTFGDDGLIAESQGHYDQAAYDRQLEHGVK
jgi:hypothetical protein